MQIEFSEYMHAARDGRASPQLIDGRELANQTVAIGGASAQSAAFNDKAGMIVISDVQAACRICIGSPALNAGVGPTAVSAGVGQTRLLKAGSEYAFKVERGDKIAVITA
jgi:hypothetical protein